MLARTVMLFAAAAVLVPRPATGATLALGQLDAMALGLQCLAACRVPVGQEACLATCPALDAGWEKNGRGPVTATDHELALLEYWDAGRGIYVCEQEQVGAAGTIETVLRPASFCAPPVDCTLDPAPSGCEDADSDGLLAWQESAAGTSDAAADTICDDNLACRFDQRCSFNSDHGESLCIARSCGAEGCTAFRLLAVATTAQELIVHLLFDYAPAPVTVLDVKLTYAQQSLELLDARSLPALEAAGKEVGASHLAGGTLRLLVAGAFSLDPVPYGAIVELVFLRTQPNVNAFVAFSDDPVHRRYSMAPEQGVAQEDLTLDASWGADINIGASIGPRTLLSYTFDDPARPLFHNAAPPAADLCAQLSGCPGDVNQLGLLAGLQQGSLLGGLAIDGVRASGHYLRGTQDHIRFPLTHANVGDDAFTLTGWFYAEAASSSPSPGDPQLLFSHLATDGRTAFGIRLDPLSDGSVDVVWYEGQYDQSPAEQVIAASHPRLVWSHLAVTYDGAQLAFLLDGLPAGVRTFAGGIACPQRDPSFSIPQMPTHGAVYISRAENGLYLIERMDPLGLVVEPVLSSGQFSFRDPDYSAVVDRLVYASNESGNYEIWMAKRDGQDSTQLTVGFGDTSRGVFARRPRWGPAGKGIIFESNIHSVSPADNTGKTSQLYYIPVGRDVDQMPLPATLDYHALLASGTLSDHRLTSGADHATGAAWLRDAAPDGSSRGDILYTRSSSDFRSRSVARLIIDDPAYPQPLDLGIAGEPLDEDVRLLDAFRSQDGSVHEVLVQRSWAELAPAAQFSYAVSISDVVEVTVTHTPTGYAATCWDMDQDGALDPATEDLDGDGIGTIGDCYPSSVRDLYLEFELVNAAHELLMAQPNPVLESTASDGLAKVVNLEEEYPGAVALVRIDVGSPYDDRPIPAGTDLVTLVFTPLGNPGPPDGVPNNGAGDFSLRSRAASSEVYVKPLGGVAQPVQVSSYLDDATVGSFSPDGNAVLIAGFWQARPTLVRADLQGTQGVLRLAPGSHVLKSLSFRGQTELLACNWVGAFRNPYTGTYRGGFRGGLDEVTLYNYAREKDAILSEVERGQEWLERSGLDGVLEPRVATCSTDVNCPPYTLCESGRCETRDCSTMPCPRGLCTVRPLGAGTHGSDAQWVCTAECATDSECFVEECLNGPCRFCDTVSSSCVECRQAVSNVGSNLPPIVSIEGCPDRNSFTCESGSCYTECYSFENNQSEYLCQTPTEYCEGGRCVPVEWTWGSLSPATLSGAGEVLFADPGQWELPAIARNHLIQVRIQAFGVSDYLHPPQMLVEGCRADGFCFAIGEVEVDNRTSTFERAPWYVLRTPWIFSELRLRLVVPPPDNLNDAATGWLGQERLCDSGGAVPDPCVHAAPGSLYNLGYPGEVPYQLVMADAGLTDGHAGREYLRPGSPAVIVTRVEVAGTGVSQPNHNKICSYEGTREPFETTVDPVTGAVTRRPRKMFFGASELSNHRDGYCQSCPGFGLTELVSPPPPAPGWPNKGWALLNCAFADPSSGIASATYAVDIPDPIDGTIQELGGNCLYTEPAGDPRCYEWEYRPSIDAFIAEMQLIHTLDFEDFGSLGDDDGFVSVVQP